MLHIFIPQNVTHFHCHKRSLALVLAARRNIPDVPLRQILPPPTHQSAATAALPPHPPPPSPQPCSHSAHFPTIPAVSGPLQAGRQALVVEEDLRLDVCTAVGGGNEQQQQQQGDGGG